MENGHAPLLAAAGEGGSDLPGRGVTTIDCLQLHCTQCDGTDIDVTALAKFRPNERWRLVGFIADTPNFFWCHTCNAHVSVKERR